MLTALNLFFLGIASGILGLWGRRMLLDLSIIRGFEAGLWACAVIAAVYAAVHILFRAFLMFIKPTRTVSLEISEMLAQISSLVLLPSLLGFRFPVPYATLERVEPLIHLAVFAVLLSFFRLMAFFAAIYGEKSSHTVTLRWGLYAALSLVLVAGSIYKYLEAVEIKREFYKAEPVSFAEDNTYANAYPVPEKKRVLLPLEKGEGDQISILCSPKPGDTDFPESVFVRLETYDRQMESQANVGDILPTTTVTRVLSFAEEGWTPLPVSYSELPRDTRCISVSWTVEDPDGIIQRLGVLPSDPLDRTLMVSGPWAQKIISRGGNKPSVVVILVEGMGAENMSLYGYERETTPSLAKHAADMIMCEEAYTPTPEARGAAMSLLTGLNPLTHGYYESGAGPLPASVCSLAETMQNNGYFTVAFTEGRGITRHDLVFGSGFEKGFILFDDYFPIEARNNFSADTAGPMRVIPAGAHITLGKARNWIEANPGLQYFAFIRLRELSEPRYLLRYGRGFMRRMGFSSPMDVYDTAVAYMDRQLGLFLDVLKAMPEEQQPVVVITSTNGFDFREPGRGAWRRRGEPRRSLFESALRIPLLIRVPGQPGQTNKTPASLVDVAPTLIALTNIAPPYRAEGANVLETSRMREIISVMGDPVEQSMRSGKWRFTWQTGLSPQSLEPVEKESIIEFLDIARYRDAEMVQDNVRQEPQLVEAFKMQLSTALRDSYLGNTVVTMIPRSISPL